LKRTALSFDGAVYWQGKTSAATKTMKGTLDVVKKAKTARDSLSDPARVKHGCTTHINGNFCLIYEPIYADYENDTPETIRQKEHYQRFYE
jgi:hypothetical protein